MADVIVLSSTSALVAALALAIERLGGYPDWLYGAIRHPVVWIGRLIDRLDQRLNRGEASPTARRRRGILALALLLAVTLAVTLPLMLLLRALPGGFLVEALLASTLLSQNSLRWHVMRVAEGLDEGVEHGRAAVAHIVGRDPQQLDGSGVSRAAIESLAENASDGVTAPLIWMIIGGLPAVALYKAINTADSMIGHKSAKYRDFGWASARLDDFVNLPASRLTGLLFALSAGLADRSRGKEAIDAMRRDAPNHLSPNAGWPEAAMAGALGISLGGPRAYGGKPAVLASMGGGRDLLSAADIREALAIYDRTLGLIFALAMFWLALRWAVL